MTPLSSPRRHDVDNLRSLAVLMLVPFHTARLFDATPWHMKDAAAPQAAAAILLRAIELWQMPLLFLLAGIAAAHALRTRGPRAFLRERVARLLLPLGFGILVLVPPQVWAERVSPTVPLRQSAPIFEGGFVEFLPGAFVCCYPAASLSWHHLWFLPYLFIYAVLTALISRAGDGAWLARWTAACPWRLLLPVVPLAACEILLRPIFPGSHDLVTDWANHAHYALLVLLGWWFARNPAPSAAVDRHLPLFAGLAAMAGTLWFAALPVGRGGLGAIEAAQWALSALRSAAEWLVLLSLLGAAARWLARPIRPLAAFAPLSMPFYMLHQTVIVLLGWALFGWDEAPAWKGLTIAGATVALSLAGAALVARSAFLRLLFGMGASRDAPAARAVRSAARAPTPQSEPPLAASVLGVGELDGGPARRGR